MKNIIFILSGVFAGLILQGCTRSVPVYTPGYYQEGKYESAGYMPAHYNAFGQFYPAQDYAASYEEPRWHRAYYKYRLQHVAPKPWVSGTLVGGVAGGGIGALVGGGSTAATATGAGLGALVGYHYSHTGESVDAAQDDGHSGHDHSH